MDSRASLALDISLANLDVKLDLLLVFIGEHLLRPPGRIFLLELMYVQKVGSSDLY